MGQPCVTSLKKLGDKLSLLVNVIHFIVLLSLVMSETLSEKKRNCPENDKAEDYGVIYFPNRHNQASETGPTEVVKSLFMRGKDNDFRTCVKNVQWCVENNAMVRLLMGAMKKHGCNIKLSRHVSCEECKGPVNGGYDPIHNQVVICQTRSRKRDLACSVLTHEMLHMFDHCRAKLDIMNNIEHLACTEVRAANLNHCSFTAAAMDGTVSPMDYAARHHECVRLKAFMSVVSVRNVSMQEALDAVNKVFFKCYNDMEPFGRRLRKTPMAAKLALREGYLYGYSDSRDID